VEVTLELRQGAVLCRREMHPFMRRIEPSRHSPLRSHRSHGTRRARDRPADAVRTRSPVRPPWWVTGRFRAPVMSKAGPTDSVRPGLHSGAAAHPGWVMCAQPAPRMLAVSHEARAA
jgi:hypothetical protein